MKNIKNYLDFITEAKKGKKDSGESNDASEVKKEVKSILDDIFDKASKINFKTNKDGVPTSVEFFVTKEDFSVEYDEPLVKDYTDAVRIKRNWDVELEFCDKKKIKEGEEEKYKMVFDVEIKKVDKEKLKKEPKKRRVNFEKDSSAQLRGKLRSPNFTDEEKEEMKEILSDRGVEYVDNSDDEEDDIPEEELEKKFTKAAEKMSKKEK